MPKTAQKSFDTSTWHEGFVPLALVVSWAGVTAIVSLLFFQAMDDTRMRVRATHDVLVSLKDFLSSTLDAETGQRGYLITQNDRYLAPYKDGLENAERAPAPLRGSARWRSRDIVASDRAAQALGRKVSKVLALKIKISKEGDIETARAAVGHDRGKDHHGWDWTHRY